MYIKEFEYTYDGTRRHVMRLVPGQKHLRHSFVVRIESQKDREMFLAAMRRGLRGDRHLNFPEIKISFFDEAGGNWSVTRLPRQTQILKNGVPITTKDHQGDNGTLFGHLTSPEGVKGLSLRRLEAKNQGIILSDPEAIPRDHAEEGFLESRLVNLSNEFCKALNAKPCDAHLLAHVLIQKYGLCEKIEAQRLLHLRFSPLAKGQLQKNSGNDEVRLKQETSLLRRVAQNFEHFQNAQQVAALLFKQFRALENEIISIEKRIVCKDLLQISYHDLARLKQAYTEHLAHFNHDQINTALGKFIEESLDADLATYIGDLERLLLSGAQVTSKIDMEIRAAERLDIQEQQRDDDPSLVNSGRIFFKRFLKQLKTDGEQRKISAEMMERYLADVSNTILRLGELRDITELSREQFKRIREAAKANAEMAKRQKAASDQLWKSYSNKYNLPQEGTPEFFSELFDLVANWLAKKQQLEMITAEIGIWKATRTELIKAITHWRESTNSANSVDLNDHSILVRESHALMRQLKDKEDLLNHLQNSKASRKTAMYLVQIDDSMRGEIEQELLSLCTAMETAPEDTVARMFEDSSLTGLWRKIVTIGELYRAEIDLQQSDNKSLASQPSMYQLMEICAETDNTDSVYAALLEQAASCKVNYTQILVVGDADLADYLQKQGCGTIRWQVRDENPAAPEPDAVQGRATLQHNPAPIAKPAAPALRTAPSLNDSAQANPETPAPSPVIKRKAEDAVMSERARRALEILTRSKL